MWRDRVANWRDRLAARLVNLVLRTVATRQYRDFIAGAILYGMNSAARDTTKDLDPPPDWQQHRASKVLDPPCFADTNGDR